MADEDQRNLDEAEARVDAAISNLDASLRGLNGRVRSLAKIEQQVNHSSTVCQPRTPP